MRKGEHILELLESVLQGKISVQKEGKIKGYSVANVRTFYEPEVLFAKHVEGESSSKDSDTELIAPSTPESLSGSSQNEAVSSEWDVVDETDSYRVYRSTSSGVDASGDPLGNGIDSADYVDESAENGTKYFYVVTAVMSENGKSAESNSSKEVETLLLVCPIDPNAAKYPCSRAP